MNRTSEHHGYHRFFRYNLLCGLLTVLLAVLPARSATAGGRIVARASVFAGTHAVEHNPTFLPKTGQVVYLAFSGDGFHSQPWENQLIIQEAGKRSRSLMSHVVDYQIVENGDRLRILTAEPRDPDAQTRELDCRIHEYEPDTMTDRVLVEQVCGEGPPLQDLLMDFLTAAGTTADDTEIWAPDGRRMVSLHLRGTPSRLFYDFVPAVGGDRGAILSTELYRTYADYRWQPPVVWTDSESFVTLIFKSNPDSQYPQSDGVFAVVRVDLQEKQPHMLYADPNIKAFPEFTLNPAASALYFIRQVPGESEICRLDLSDSSVSEIYRIAGDIAQLRISGDGTTLLFCHLTDDNSDIIRLDLIVSGLQLANNE